MLGKGSVVLLVLSMEVVACLWVFFFGVVVSSSVLIRVDSVREAGAEAEAGAGGLVGFGVGESMELILFFVFEWGERSEEEDVADS